MSTNYRDAASDGRVVIAAADGTFVTRDGAVIGPDAPSGAAGGDLSGTFPNPTVSKVNGLAATSVVTRTAVAVPYAASVTPALPSQGDALYNVAALTGAITIANPSGTPSDGQVIQFRLAQDVTGGRVITWGAAYAFGTDVTAALTPTAASAKWVMVFSYDAASSTWRALQIVRGF